MRWCNKCKSSGECGVCYFETSIGQVVGLMLIEKPLKWAADRKVKEELLKKVTDESVKQGLGALGQEAIKDVLLCLETATSPWMWSAIVTEFVSYYVFKLAESSEEDARKNSSIIGFITSFVAGGCVGGPVGLVVGCAAWFIGHNIPDPFVVLMEKLIKKLM